MAALPSASLGVGLGRVNFLWASLWLFENLLTAREAEGTFLPLCRVEPELTGSAGSAGSMRIYTDQAGGIRWEAGTEESRDRDHRLRVTQCTQVAMRPNYAACVYHCLRRETGKKGRGDRGRNPP